MKYLFAACISAFLFTSCSKASFRISVTLPPVISVPEDVHSFIILNNVTDSNSPDDLLKKVLKGQIPNGNLIAAEQTITGLLRSFDDSKYYKGIVFREINLRNKAHLPDWNKIDSICNTNLSQGVIEIATFRSQAPVGGVVLDNVLGKTNSTLSGSGFFNIYLPGYQSYLERLETSGFYNIPISGNIHPLNVLNDVLRKQEYYGALGFTVGRKMGESMISTWHWVNRQYYKKGSRELKMAKNLIRKGHWDLAEKQLQSGLKHPSRKVKGRTMFNMALVFEGQGHLNKAIEMAERSAFEGTTRPAYDYINVLKRRLNQQSLIYFP